MVTALNRHCAAGLATVEMAASIDVRPVWTRRSSPAACSRCRTPDGEEAHGGHPGTGWTRCARRTRPRRHHAICRSHGEVEQAKIIAEEVDALALAGAVHAHDRGLPGVFIEYAARRLARPGLIEQPPSVALPSKPPASRFSTPEIPDFSITAGNSWVSNDAAAVLTLTLGRLGRRLSLTPLATVRSWASIGVTPNETATRRRSPFQRRWPGPASTSPTSPCGRSTKHSPACRLRLAKCWVSTRSWSTSREAAAAWATRLRPAVPAWSPRSSMTSSVAVAASVSPPCAPAAAWVPHW